MTPRRFNDEDINALPTEEVNQLLPHGHEAILFGAIMGLCMLVAGLVAGLGYIYHQPRLWHLFGGMALAFLAIGVIGEELKYRRFRRKVNEAIKQNKNRTTP